MIKLTRLSGEEFVLNADLIRYVERRPDTFITLVSDERVIVRETPEQVIERTIEFARAIRFVPGLSRRG